MLKYNVPRTTLNDWIKNKDKFLTLNSYKINKTTMHKGPKPLNLEI